MFRKEVEKFGELSYNEKGEFLSFKLKHTDDIDPELSELLKDLKLID